MTPNANTLWRYIETKYMSTTSGWSNNLDYGTTVDESDIISMVEEVFGEYDKNRSFWVGTTQYRIKVKPLQNKNERAQHAYGVVRGGGENKINVLCHQVTGGDRVGFNLHVQVRKANYAAAANKRAANKKAAAAGEWQTG